MAGKYKVKITASGFIYIFMVIVLGVAAVNTGNNLLYLLSSIMLALMAISGLSSLINLLFLNISISPSAEVFADIPARFELNINKGVGGSFFLKCDTAFGSLKLPYVKSELKKSLWLKFPERGKARLDDLIIHSGFPLGFFRRFKKCPATINLIVYPKPITRSFIPPTGGVSGYENRSDSFFGELDDEIKELRKYRNSDPLKWVEWKATARRGKVVVREFYHLEGDTLIIDLSVKTSAWERKLSEACFLVLEGYRRKLSIGIKFPDRKIEPGRGEKHRKILLEALTFA